MSTVPLFAKLPWPGDSEVTFYGFRVKLPQIVCYLSNHSEKRYLVKCLAS